MKYLALLLPLVLMGCPSGSPPTPEPLTTYTTEVAPDVPAAPTHHDEPPVQPETAVEIPPDVDPVVPDSDPVELPDVADPVRAAVTWGWDEGPVYSDGCDLLVGGQTVRVIPECLAGTVEVIVGLDIPYAGCLIVRNYYLGDNSELTWADSEEFCWTEEMWK